MAEHLQRSLKRAFAGHAPCSARAAFERVFDAPVLSYRHLLHWAQTPEELFEDVAELTAPAELA